jgi:hypothetical protein
MLLTDYPQFHPAMIRSCYRRRGRGFDLQGAHAAVNPTKRAELTLPVAPDPMLR